MARSIRVIVTLSDGSQFRAERDTDNATAATASVLAEVAECQRATREFSRPEALDPRVVRFGATTVLATLAEASVYPASTWPKFRFSVNEPWHPYFDN